MAFTIQYPASSPTETVTLRSPELGNSFTENQNKIERQLPTGQYDIFAPSGRVDGQRVYEFSFRILSATVLENLEDMLVTHAGEPILATDHNGDSVTGILSLIEVEEVDNSPSSDCPDYNVTLGVTQV